MQTPANPATSQDVNNMVNGNESRKHPSRLVVRGHDRVFKVVVVGESGVGKSCLVGSLCDEPYIEDRSPTIGSDIRNVTLTVDNLRVKISAWDTAGQERFRTLTSAFYRGAHLVLLCFDITDFDSFEKLKHWFRELELNVGTSEHTVKLLIGTKIDKERQRTVKRQDAVDLAAFYKCECYLETSSFTGSGVKDAFEQGVRRVLQIPAFKDPAVATISIQDDNFQNAVCC